MKRRSIFVWTSLALLLAAAAVAWNSPARAQEIAKETHRCKFDNEPFTTAQIEGINLKPQWEGFIRDANALREKRGEPPLNFKLVACGEPDSMRTGDTLYVTPPAVIAHATQ